MQRLMPDSSSLKAERRVQPRFRKVKYFNSLLLAAIILAAHGWLQAIANRADRPDAIAAVRFAPIASASAGFAPLRLAGAWRVEVGDSRFGGVSALAIDRRRLLALTDSGTLVRLPRPGQGKRASLRDLPAGPGNPGFKRNRDSEALARDPRGRGWWVAFEQWHQLWLFDAGFERVLGTVDLGRGRWRANRGIEAMAADPAGLILFAEESAQWWRIGAGGGEGPRRLVNRFGLIAEAARLPDGRLLLVTRKPGLAGLVKRLLLVDENGQEPVLRSLARLELGATANVEALAAEPRAGGGTRLWLMTDNDFRPRTPTLLVALDMP